MINRESRIPQLWRPIGSGQAALVHGSRRGRRLFRRPCPGPIQRETHRCPTRGRPRWRPARTELTDRILIFREQHLRAVLAQYGAHYNDRRPHRALAISRYDPTIPEGLVVLPWTIAAPAFEPSSRSPSRSGSTSPEQRPRRGQPAGSGETIQRPPTRRSRRAGCSPTSRTSTSLHVDVIARGRHCAWTSLRVDVIARGRRSSPSGASPGRWFSTVRPAQPHPSRERNACAGAASTVQPQDPLPRPRRRLLPQTRQPRPPTPPSHRPTRTPRPVSAGTRTVVRIA